MNLDDTILIVEDDEGHSILIKKCLERYGVKNTVKVINTGEGLLEFLSCNRDNVSSFFILLDLVLPGINGLELLKILKSDKDYKKIPVCMMSVHCKELIREECISAGALCCFIKPIEYSEFCEKIKTLSVFIIKSEENGEDLSNPSDMGGELKDIIDKLVMGKDDIVNTISNNVDKYVLPIVKKIKNKKMISKNDLNILEFNIKDLSSGFYEKLTKAHSSLTPMEIRICKLVCDGFQDKEIADVFCVSTATIQSHRKNIRQKLGLRNTSENLRDYLSRYAVVG